jgi:alkylhydroperoxidase family enzyme
MAEEDCEELKKAGFKDDEILDIVQVTSYFNFVNRLACGLGIGLEPYWEPSTP